MIPKELRELLLAGGVDRDRDGSPIVFTSEEPWCEKQPGGQWLASAKAQCRVSGVWVPMARVLADPGTLKNYEDNIIRAMIDVASDSGWTGLKCCAHAGLKGDARARAACLAVNAAHVLVDEWSEVNP